MPLHKSRNALVAAGVITGWVIFSVVSNWRQVRFLYCKNPIEKDTGEVICRAMNAGTRIISLFHSLNSGRTKALAINPEAGAFNLY